MDRIAEIIELEKVAEEDDAEISARRWRAARLIWEELKAGRTKPEIAQAIGKTGQHVLYMQRCWEFALKLGLTDIARLPLFNKVYNSPEVRNKGMGRPRGSKNRPKGDEPQESASAWIATAEASLRKLQEHRATWDFLGDDDLETLRGLPDQAESVLAAVEARFASA